MQNITNAIKRIPPHPKHPSASFVVGVCKESFIFSFVLVCFFLFDTATKCFLGRPFRTTRFPKPISRYPLVSPCLSEIRATLLSSYVFLIFVSKAYLNIFALSYGIYYHKFIGFSSHISIYLNFQDSGYQLPTHPPCDFAQPFGRSDSQP